MLPCATSRALGRHVGGGNGDGRRADIVAAMDAIRTREQVLARQLLAALRDRGRRYTASPTWQPLWIVSPRFALTFPASTGPRRRCHGKGPDRHSRWTHVCAAPDGSAGCSPWIAGRSARPSSTTTPNPRSSVSPKHSRACWRKLRPGRSRLHSITLKSIVVYSRLTKRAHSAAHRSVGFRPSDLRETTGRPALHAADQRGDFGRFAAGSS